MITKEKKIEKICSFYASDYHLEMIMIPYINKKIEEKSNIIVITEKDLSETVNKVISRVNLSEKRKTEILSLNWSISSIFDVNQIDKNKELIVFVVGNVNFIKKINEQVIKIDCNKMIKIINCYNIDEIQNSITEIVTSHEKVLNTTEEKELN